MDNYINCPHMKNCMVYEKYNQNVKNGSVLEILDSGVIGKFKMRKNENYECRLIREKDVSLISHLNVNNCSYLIELNLLEKKSKE